MTQDNTLVSRTKERIEEIAQKSSSSDQGGLFSPEVEEAMRLADMYAAIKPQEYILPLDAMAGFPVSATAHSK